MEKKENAEIRNRIIRKTNDKKKNMKILKTKEERGKKNDVMI